MAKRLVVIGGTAAGLSAASKAKRSCPELDVTVFERTCYTSYGACGLPYFVGGLVAEPEDLITLNVEQLARRGIDTHVRHEVQKIDRERKCVEVVRLTDGRVFEAPYDILVLATGAKPLVPDIQGHDLKGVHSLRTVEDGIMLRSIVRESKRAVVIGGGFIGLEVAEQLRETGLHVEVVELENRLLPMLEESNSQMVKDALESRGVVVHTGASATEILGTDGFVHGVKLANGEEISADLVLLSIGVSPETSLAAQCGLELGPKGAIKVDAHQRTSDPDIYACGDCCHSFHTLTGKPVYVPLGTTANKQGRVAGENIVGNPATSPGVLGSLVTKVFNLTVAATGLGEAQAKREGFDAVSCTIVKSDRASYYPGGIDTRMTLVFEQKGGRLLGAQALGGPTAAGRVNVLVAAIAAGMTVQQLGELDLVYSPSVAPVYDPILIAASQALKLVQ